MKTREGRAHPKNRQKKGGGEGTIPLKSETLLIKQQNGRRDRELSKGDAFVEGQSGPQKIGGFDVA